MKKILMIVGLMFVCVAAIAQTVSVDWMVDNDIYAQNTCEYGGTLTVPSTAPTKYGYTFQGWGVYQRLEYIESSRTQYIDTGIITHNDVVRIDMDMKLTAIINNENHYFLAVGTGFGVRGESIAFGISNGKWSMILPGYNWNTFGAASTGRVQFSWTITLDGKSEITGDLIKTTTDSSFYGPNLGWRQKTWNFGSTYIEVYAVKIYLNNTLVRDFIPVLDSLGVPCMYDKVTQQFFYNQGTGDFIAGPMLNE